MKRCLAGSVVCAVVFWMLQADAAVALLLN